jgi:hypothetical protein
MTKEEREPSAEEEVVARMQRAVSASVRARVRLVRRGLALRVAIDAFALGFLLACEITIPTARGWLLVASLFAAFELGYSLQQERRRP